MLSFFLILNMSPEENPLQDRDLAVMVSLQMASRSDQARLRIRDEMERQKLSQREVADLLKWSQSRVGKILIGRVGLDLDDLDALCFVLGISLTEAVRDHGFEFCAEMTPTELRFLERLRKLPQPDQDALMRILAVAPATRAQDRRAHPSKKVNNRLR